MAVNEKKLGKRATALLSRIREWPLSTYSVESGLVLGRYGRIQGSYGRRDTAAARELARAGLVRIDVISFPASTIYKITLVKGVTQ